MSSTLKEDMYLPPGGKVNASGFWESATHRQCSKCRTLFEKTSAMSWCRKCNSDRRLSISPEWRMHQRAKVRAKRLGRDFTLSVEDITIPATCPILGIRLVAHSGKSGAFPDSPALDRIDNSKGYTKDNVRVISQRANQMKGDASQAELETFARYILGDSKP